MEILNLGLSALFIVMASVYSSIIDNQPEIHCTPKKHQGAVPCFRGPMKHQGAVPCFQRLPVLVVPLIIPSGTKRKYPEVDEGESSQSKVEDWSLRDVIFVDHVTNLNVGSVLKLDGSYAAVHYPALGDDQDLSQVDISKCRLLRKEELVVSTKFSGKILIFT